ncbi:MAG: SBBP repeat-containing protein [Bacteroidetes bacterium]|nr:SBBP repeat-containing protein [Bacteroidota bacterium]
MKRNTFLLTFLPFLILWGICTKNMYAQGGRLWGTYYGGSEFDDIGLSWSAGKCIAGDAAGNVYIAAETSSPNNIAAGGFLNVYTGGGWYEGFVTKFDAAGNRLWGTYYGAGFAKNTQATSVAVDNIGNVYAAGFTNNNANISLGGFQNAFAGGGTDAFLVKFDANGNRLWATYYGGPGADWGLGVSTDPFGNVYLAGTTASLSGIASGGFLNVIPPGWALNAFLVKFDPAGNRLWATYYGNSASEYGWAVVTDAFGNVYLGGYTASLAGIASGGFQNVHGGNLFDAFLVKFDAAGNRLWATYYGGNADDLGRDLAVDPLGNIYLSGLTQSNVGIASGGFQNAIGNIATNDAFLVKFDPAGNRLWATYYGGTGIEDGWGVTCNNAGDVFLCGETSSLAGIASGGFQNVYGGGATDAFMVRFDASGNRLCATYYGGTGDDRGFSVLSKAAGAAYLFGNTNGNDGISSGGFQNMYGGGFMDVFLTKLSACNIILTATIVSTDVSCKGTCNGLATVSSSGGTAPFTYLWNDGQTAQTPTGLCAGTYTVTVSDDGNNTGTQTVTITQPDNALTSGLTSGLINCYGGTTTAMATAGGGTPVYTYNWSAGVTGSGFQVSGLLAGNYTVTITDSKGCISTSTASITSPPAIAGQFTKGTAGCTGCGCKEWIMVTATGGTSPYSYLWTGGYIERYKNHLCPGTYTINVKDKNGCSINVNLSAP